MKNSFYLIFLYMFVSFQTHAQITNAENLSPFLDRLKENNSVTQILFIGDSHIQAGWFTDYLRIELQQKFGNAGRGLVFPYSIANSNGLDDIKTVSNTTWENFRLVYDQDVFPQMGISGFVMGNKEPSLIEFSLKPEEAFDKVVIFHDHEMADDSFEVWDTHKSLKDYIKKDKQVKTIQVQEDVTFPELASNSYTTTTRLYQLNRSTPYKAGNSYKTELTKIIYNTDFEQGVNKILKSKFDHGITTVELPAQRNDFLLHTEGFGNHVFYGFQFLNTIDKGVVLNTVGVNGATYADFTKYSLTLEQMNALNANLVIIALGTNESLSDITEETFKADARQLMTGFKEKDEKQPILLVSPTENLKSAQKIALINQWIADIAQEENVAYLDFYNAMGGPGYFRKALARKEANRDGVHFLKPGYEKQAQKLYQELIKLLEN